MKLTVARVLVRPGTPRTDPARVPSLPAAPRPARPRPGDRLVQALDVSERR